MIHQTISQPGKLSDEERLVLCSAKGVHIQTFILCYYDNR